ncbi:hypothetical protein RHMOL_Rhmol09G0160000 [Rhododendron molle]|uniref:Uncharacterized protein n=1 Tax=Rhododendron molle TaxID=49168 RepID=A0ACC0MDM6_RHOML|nr:hypothetical protein RHMOL_Rhmol09G0160000 [Rhododendron molle]
MYSEISILSSLSPPMGPHFSGTVLWNGGYFFSLWSFMGELEIVCCNCNSWENA